MTPEQQKALALARARLSVKNKQGGQPPGQVADPSRSSGGFLTGLMDPFVGAAQGLINLGYQPKPQALASSQQSRDIYQQTKDIGRQEYSDATNQNVKQREQDYQARRAQEGETGLDGDRLFGNVLGTAPAMMIPGGQTAAGALGYGALAGGLTAAAMPVTEDDYATEKGNQVATGIVTGGAFGPVVRGVSSFINPKMAPQLKLLKDGGVTPTPGQSLGGIAKATEEKLTSVPGLGDSIAGAYGRTREQFNRLVYNEVLKPVGKAFKGAVGREGVAEVQSILSREYDSILPNLQFRADKGFADEVTSLVDEAKAVMLPQRFQQFKNIVEANIAPRLKSGFASGEEIKILENAINKQAGRFSKSLSSDEQMVGDALEGILSAVRSNLERSNPQYATKLADVNRGWAMFSRLRDAASRQGAEDGVFTPAQLSAAVRAGDNTVGKGAFAKGSALLQDISDAGKAILPSKYPDSGSVGRGLMAGAAAGYVDPALLAGGVAASLPYTDAGGRAASYLMNAPKLGDRSGLVSRGINRLSIPLAVGGSVASTQP